MIIELGSVTEKTKGLPVITTESDSLQPGPEQV